MAFTEKKKLLELSPDKIVPNPTQPRLDFPQDELLQKARAWSVSHAGTSGRVARQFIDSLK